MQAWERALERWQGAGLVDAATADRVRAFEAAEAHPTGARWQVVVALLFGGILLSAGVLLFVAAHWDTVAPGARLVTVLGLLAMLHVGGVFTAERFPTLSTALHGVGTVACGGAIATIGQIFNMQEHWPAAVLLWAGCAAAGWWLLRDQFQQICTLVLLPGWIVCEWSFRGYEYSAGQVFLARMLAVIGAVYLTAFVHSRRRAVAGVLFGVGSVLLVVATVLLLVGWERWSRNEGLPVQHRIGSLLVIAGAMAAGTLGNRRSILPAAAVLAMGFALPWLQVTHHIAGNNGPGTDWTAPSLLAHLLVAGVAAFFAWWGVQERSRAVVIYAVAMFAVVVVWFYFSDVMDKLGRSLGLIGLGLLFLLGGWFLEKLRRRLVQTMQSNRLAEVQA